jgi:hypothetical protein
VTSWKHDVDHMMMANELSFSFAMLLRVIMRKKSLVNISSINY